MTPPLRPLPILLGLGFMLAASLPSAIAQVIASEPFAAYAFDQNLGASAQPNPPASTGITSYTTTNTIVTNHVRVGSIPWGSLTTSGGKFEVSGGGVAVIGAVNTSAGSVFSPYLEGGAVGRPGTTLYLSFVMQLKGVSTTSTQNIFALRRDSTTRLSFGQNWNQPNFYANASLGIPIDTEPHLFVARIVYGTGNAQVTVWFDPDLDLPESSQTPARTFSGAMDFNNLEFKGQGTGHFIDEIRWGANWSDVLPRTDVFTLNVTARPGGSVYRNPVLASYTLGTSVYIEANGQTGYRFVRWIGNPPPGMETSNPLRLTMDRNYSLEAEFAPGIPTFFTFDPGLDPPDENGLLSLRALNEEVAGQSGRVTREGDKFLLGDGTPVRFWATTSGVPGGAELPQMVRFLARRGVNLVRYHSSLYNNNAPAFRDVNLSRIDDIHRLVVAARAEGIYTKLSFFFILGLRIRAEWGVEGYTQAWIDANPDYSGSAPFALQFFDPTFKEAYKNWMREMLTRPNPHDQAGRPLAQDPAVAMIELQNEDNLFFHTFVPERFPPPQLRRLEKLFGDFLIAKYGSLPNAISQWGGSSQLARDDHADGRMTLRTAWHMSRSFTGQPGRMADQILFLRRLQKDWYSEMAAFARHELGYGGLFSASNWSTADNPVLLDVEWETYTATDVIDMHNYFSSVFTSRAVGTTVSGGDRYFGIPAVNNPRRLPVAIKQVEGHPSMISESTWTLPTDFKPEAALLVGSYGALIDLDCFVWFAHSRPSWNAGTTPWVLGSPALAGMFPGAALIYRRGDVSEAPVVVRESRSLLAASRKEPALLSMTFGWDPVRDPNQEFNYNPDTQQGQVDSLATLVGKVEMAFEEGGASFVSPAVAAGINNSASTVTSVNGQLRIQSGAIEGASGTPAGGASGHFTVNTPRAQGAAGYLAAASPLLLDNVTLSMANNFGTVLAIALDDLPLSQSRRVLIQAAAREWMRGSGTTPTQITWNGRTYSGKTIDPLGTLPWQMEGISASVTLHGMGRVTSVTALDGNGYFLTSLPLPIQEHGGERITLPGDALYTLVELAQPGFADWEAFTESERADPAISGPNADPDRDGIPNLAEYMLGLDPKTPDQASLPMHHSMVTSPEGPFLWQISIRLRDSDPGAAFRLELSDRLGSWSDASGEMELIAREEHGDGFSTYTWRSLLPMEPGRSRFARVAFFFSP